MQIRMVPTLIVAAVLTGCGGHGAGTLPAADQAQSPAGIKGGGGTPAQYAVTNLGTLGGSFSGGNSINGKGWVTGLSALSGNSTQHATLWSGGTITDLGTLGGANSAVEWPVHNDRGLIAGISETSTTDPLGESWSCAAFIPSDGHTCLGFAWENAKLTALATLGGNNGYAAGVDTRGDIAGWAETTKHDSTCVSPQVLQFEAVIWSGPSHAVHELPPLHGDRDGAATAANDRGEVVGISGICDQAVGRFTARHAVVWENGVATDIGNLGGVAWNTPAAIDGRGDIVGFSDLPGDSDGTPNFHAFLWTKHGGMRDLGTLPGDAYSEALGINQRGQIVGVSYAAGFASSRAFIWQNGTMTDLNKAIGPHPRLSLLYANDINNAGQIAGGACILKADKCGAISPAFLATPAD